MGKMSDSTIDASTSKELNKMIDDARAQHTLGYVQFLEEQLEKAEIEISNLKEILRREKGPGHCVECFKSLPGKEIICSLCQDESDGRWDHLKEINNEM